MTSRRELAATLAVILCCLGQPACRRNSAPQSARSELNPLPQVSLAQSSPNVACYDYVEVTLTVRRPNVPNPFTDVFVTGEFGIKGDAHRVGVDGFNDSADGSVFRVRFMPAVPGLYEYEVRYWQDNGERVLTGTFRATEGRRRGLLATDVAYPWHFVWLGTSEHYFLNGTTAFFLMGWDDDRVIDTAIDRLHALSVNRVRVLLEGRTDHFWTEPIQPGHGFRVTLNPWQADDPEDLDNPRFDYTRFNTTYWQKFERMLKYARDRDVIVSVILAWNDTKVHPAAGSDDERRYLRYAVARLAALSNVTWDLGDDLESFRSDAWTHEAGTYLHTIDPYHHLATSHPVDNRHQDRAAEWFGMTSLQEWHRPIHAWMLQQRDLQRGAGRVIPQVNEEYGYEDHYPAWAPYKAPAASADADRRTAWEISMAGAYQTTGETAKRGTGVPPDTGGGWVNGRGDDTMTMLNGYAHMVDFFTAFEWWRADPHDELVGAGAMCLAEPGRSYAVYLPRGGHATVTLAPGRYSARWFDPRQGHYTLLSDVEGSRWTSPDAPDGQDWVLILRSLSTSGASN